MRLLDTNVFIYAHGKAHPYREPCRILVANLAAGPLAYTIDTELLQEVMHVYDARGDRAFGLVLFDSVVEVFANPVPISGVEIRAARWLLGESASLSPRDAIHAAVVLTHGLEGIVTTDRAFREVRGLRVFDPLDLAPKTTHP